MAHLNGSGRTSDTALEKGLGHEPHSGASEPELQEGHNIEAGVDNVTEQSPRNIHGWKVLQPSYLEPRRHILTISSVGDSIHLHAVYDVPLLA